ncbi:MAG: hypothetical protein RM338_02305 [Nostoc sp. DedQUE12a]|nr:hypothetical protein [Nostoc sp. DedQUE12a]
MPNIEISKLDSVGYELFDDSESFLNEIGNEEIQTLNGGGSSSYGGSSFYGGLGYSGLGYGGLGHSGLGYSGLGYSSLGYGISY